MKRIILLLYNLILLCQINHIFIFVEFYENVIILCRKPDRYNYL
jgi:preprotein translocase subunit Sss1